MMGVMAESMTASSESALFRDFGSWMLAEQKRIFLLCQRMLQDREEASSATQDAFLKAYQSLSRDAVEIDEPGKWITRIAVNTCLDRLRSHKWQLWRKRPAPHNEGLILDMAPEKRPTAEDQVFAHQIQQRLSIALDRLSVRQRAVFALRHFEDRSLEDIADILKLDVGTVKAHMFRAVTKLRQELEDLYGRRTLEGKEV